MFTGIVQAVGTLTASEARGGDRRLRISGPLDWQAVGIGDSLAVAGVCLTVVERDAAGVALDVSNETLAKTTLGALAVGAPLNLELALRLGDPLGGHLVSGHVDGVGTVLSVADDARSQRWRFEAPAPLARYIAAKGSICVDGVSLTVNAVEGARFEVNLIPHTLAVTTFGARAPGDAVNLEIDLMARYAERLMLGEAAASAGGPDAAD
ncbi:MAG TPA: riboflavin synthase [Rhodanobacteraceae bacterium]|nr:riboflavin synthase [Rhodanobacteraceae bacterium]